MSSLRWRVGDLEIAFSQSDDGDARDPAARQRFLDRIGCQMPCVAARQVHGTTIVDAKADVGALATADGLASADDRLALAAFGADCPGLVLIARHAFAIAHCGWRGTAARIVDQVVAAMAARTGEPRDTWSAFIGPGVCGDHYEVDRAVLDARGWPAAALSRAAGDRAHLDLATAIAEDLVRHDIRTIQLSGVCTAEDPRLWSYRRRGAGLVQALVAWRR